MPAAPSMKYLYERLGDKRFQNMCAALIVSQMQDVEVFPVGQSDGGRDITAGKRGIVLQVKFTRTRVRNPVGWLNAAVKEEKANIERLVAKGCTSYIFMTNIEGSAAPDSGDRDKVADELENHSKTFGIPMSVMWCADIDAWVDLAGPDLKLSYVDMLAGSDALVALFQSAQLQKNERRERDFLRDYVGNQWKRDRRVKFTQVELRSNLLTDLFIDVAATRTVRPRAASGQLPLGDVGGLAAHLLSVGIPPLTLVEGVPGQGKSTAAQYVCQAFRGAFFESDGPDALDEPKPSHLPAEMRLPIRLDLADYALWVSGYDPFNPETEQKPAAIKPRAKIDVELYLVKHFAATTTGYDLDLAEVRDLLDRFATQIVFDGLDEVANPDVRARVVSEIDSFISRRAVARPGNMRVLVTSRPNASDLPEPAIELFQKLRLSPLDEPLRKRYLRQWASVQELEKADLRELEQTFAERTAAPHIAQLANNPMQLALLLHLIKIKRKALPSERTRVYETYMELFLEREIERSTKISSVVKDHRRALEESAAYIGWYMQGRAEVDAASTRLPEATIVRVMTGYLAGIKREAPVDEVFKAMKDRVWVLTSKQTGTYEFDVQPIREYMTARYLHEYAQSLDGRSVPRNEVLVQMLPRAYWANTARFLAGHFAESQQSDLVDSILQDLPKSRHVRQTRSTLWALLADGVFKDRPLPQTRLAAALADDVTAALLRPDDPAVETLAPDYGGDAVAAAMLELIGAEPEHPANDRRAALAAATGDHSSNTTWWLEHITPLIGSPSEASWLNVGNALRLGHTLPTSTADHLRLDPPAAHWAMTAGVHFTLGSSSERALLECTLDGHCSTATPNNTTEAADLLTVFSPRLLRSIAKGGTIGTSRDRTTSMARLRDQNAAFDAAFTAMKIQKNTTGTTSRWINTACVLAGIYGGPRWLFTEIAAVALAQDAHKTRTGGAYDKARPAFGPQMHYGTWVAHTRVNAANKSWWVTELDACTDQHSQATWALAVALAAPPEVIIQLISTLNSAIETLDDDHLSALLGTSQRIGTERLGRRLAGVPADLNMRPATRLLLAHHSAKPEAFLGDDPKTLAAIAALPAGREIAAAAATVLAGQNTTEHTLAMVEAFASTGGATPGIAGMTNEVAEYILASADRLPPEWVAHADRHIASSHPLQPLRAVAETSWDLN